MPRACPFLGFLLLLYSRHFLNPVSLHSQLQLPRPTKKVRGVWGPQMTKALAWQYLKLLIKLPQPCQPQPPVFSLQGVGLLSLLFSKMGRNMAVPTPSPLPAGHHGRHISFGLTSVIQRVCCLSFPLSSSVFPASQAPPEGLL